jgi:hypothetical protein
MTRLPAASTGSRLEYTTPTINRAFAASMPRARS